MQRFFRKLLLGRVIERSALRTSPLQKRINNIRAIWNNNHQDDNGIEKIVRLFLSCSQLLFPGIYIKQIACKKGREYQDLALDFYILCKVIFPIVILTNHWQHNFYILLILVYLVSETVLYIPTLIFASDLFSRPRSYKRSMMLLFFNYLEIIFAFAVFYASHNFLNKPFTHWFDAIYFSIITSSSIGYGDFYPVTSFGKLLVSIQAILFLFFILVFLNFFSTKIKSTGYFDDENLD